MTPTPAVTITPDPTGDHAISGPAEVRNRFDGRWAGGFTIIAAVPGEHGVRYTVARSSDGIVLPDSFAGEEVRRAPAPRRSGGRPGPSALPAFPGPGHRAARLIGREARH